jgi:spore maturation protein CgeB
MGVTKDLRSAVWHFRKGGMSQLVKWRKRQSVERGFAAPRDVQGVEGGWTGRGRKRRLAFAAASLPELDPVRPDIKAAVILDDFSMLAFRYEWSIHAVHPNSWRQDLSHLKIDLLFVESAWTGNNGLWRGKIAGPSGPAAPFRDLLQWCKTQGIPTVFWNKEDPPHYDDFLPAAKLFDHVFTSDSGRVEQYKADLGHSRIDVLPFAAQPAVHNPVRPRCGRHSRDVAFAGMYFSHKFPERRQQMDHLLGGAMDASAKMPLGLEIFSRRLGGDVRYQFPAPLSSRVVGSLSYAQMLNAYKSYKVFLNVNSVVDSASMCARRIFEISAAGTPVVTAPSEAVENFFTDEEVPVAVDREHAAQLTRALVDSPELNDRTVHLAQRRIWQAHTYSHRAEQVLGQVLPTLAKTISRPSISVLVPTIRPQQIEQVFQTLAAQRRVQTELVMLTHGFEFPEQRISELRKIFGLQNAVVLSATRDVSLGECLNRCADAAGGDVLTKMDDDDCYGPEYLSDQLFALSFSGADIVGKQAHYVHLKKSQANIVRFAEKEHRYTDFVIGPTIMAPRQVLLDNPFPQLGLGEDTAFLQSARKQGMTIYSADRFNYIQVRGGSEHTWQVSDAQLMASGSLRFYGEPHDHIYI